MHSVTSLSGETKSDEPSPGVAGEVRRAWAMKVLQNTYALAPKKNKMPFV